VELRLACQRPREAAHVVDDAGERPDTEERRERLGRRHAELVTADREGEPVTLELAARRQDGVHGRVVGVDVDRVRAVEVTRGWEADVVRDDVDDPDRVERGCRGGDGSI
jgi:hypothetical protein